MTQVDTGTLEVVSLSQFVSLLTKWHGNRVAQLEHLLEIPEGTEASLNETESIKLIGDARTGFLIGVTLGLAQLGTLPFVVELEDLPESFETPQAVSTEPT